MAQAKESPTRMTAAQAVKTASTPRGRNTGMAGGSDLDRGGRPGRAGEARRIERGPGRAAGWRPEREERPHVHDRIDDAAGSARGPGVGPVRPIHRITIDEYEGSIAAGAIGSRNRFHLINGYLVDKMTHNPPHPVADERCGRELLRIMPLGWHLRTAKPVRLPAHDSAARARSLRRRGTIDDYDDAIPARTTSP